MTDAHDHDAQLNHTGDMRFEHFGILAQDATQRQDTQLAKLYYRQALLGHMEAQNEAKIRNNLANILRRDPEHLEDALDMIMRAVKMVPDDARLIINSSDIILQSERHIDLDKWFDFAFSKCPDHEELRQIYGSYLLTRAVQKEAPADMFSQGFMYFSYKFDNAVKDFAKQFGVKPWHGLKQHHYRSITLLGFGGVGDIIQMLRFVPQIREYGFEKVNAWVGEELIDLLKRSDLFDAVAALEGPGI
ncbi:MAG: hypothetical protein AAF403_06305, partial [Pseudomonadota bacterium]